MADLLEPRPGGIHYPAGGFDIDPWKPAGVAVIPHAHAGRARPGSQMYITAREGAALVRAQLGDGAPIQELGYGERLPIGDAVISLHPAGHIRGSAQVRIEHRGEVWVFSGDYSLARDPVCEPFEPVRCHAFVTEASFGLPVFRWPAAEETIRAIEAWWQANRDAGRNSLLYAPPLGEAQRVLAWLDMSIGPVRCHDAIESYNRLIGGDWRRPSEKSDGPQLVIAPPALHNTAWARRYAPASSALVSGWMRIRGARRRRALDRGFVLSSHADWPGLLGAIDETGAETVWVTHRFRIPLVRWLREHGRNAVAIDAPFDAEDDE